MSGETEDDVSGWTVDTLHAHLRTLMNERDLRYEQRFRASEEAVRQQQVATEARFQGVNEFRATLADQTATFIPRTEAEAAHGRLGERLDALTARLNAMDVTAGASSGRDAGIRVTAGLVAGLIGAVAGIVVVVNLIIALAAPG